MISKLVSGRILKLFEHKSLDVLSQYDMGFLKRFMSVDEIIKFKASRYLYFLKFL